MDMKEIIRERLNQTIKETSFTMGTFYKGKVRDNYTVGNKRIIIVTDRISAFDKVLGTIPLKGELLNKMAVFWFNKTKDIVDNHLLDNPDPNISVVREVKPLPVEMVVRGYITGSLWRAYEKGERNIYGLTLPDGLKKDQKFDRPILTPTTKAEYGSHDEPLSREEIFEKELLPKEMYEWIEKKSLDLFEAGSKHLAEQGLILVDTKYEFGLSDGKPILMDEIHTPDSSRFWNAAVYDTRFANGEEQSGLDKEYVRNWLRERGYMGDGEPPVLSDEVKIGAAIRYREAFERITGKTFEPAETPALERMEKNLKEGGYLE